MKILCARQTKILQIRTAVRRWHGPIRVVQAALECAHSGLKIDLEIIHTSGDRVQDRPLSEIGGKDFLLKN